MEMAKLLRQALMKGWFMPDWSRWSADARAWKLAVPGSERATASQLEELADTLEAQGNKGAARRWLSHIIEEMIEGDSRVAAVWEKTVADSGSGALMMKAADKEDWLVAIGLKKDTTPFRAALQLLEPDEDEGWRLRPAVQDRVEGGRWITLNRAAAAVRRVDSGGAHEQEATVAALNVNADHADYAEDADHAEYAVVSRGETAAVQALRDPAAVVGGDGLAAAASGEAGSRLRWRLPQDAPAEWGPYFAERMGKEEAKWLASLPDWARTERAEDGIKTELSDGEAWAFLEDASARLLAAGCSVLLPGWWEAVRSRKMRLKAKVKSSVGSSEQPMFGLNQIVDFDWKLAVGNVDMTEAEFMRLAEENRRLMRVGGEWVHLDPDDVDRIRKWLKKKGGKRDFTMRDVLEMHLRGGSELEAEREDMEALEAEVELNEHLAAWIGKLNESADLPLVEKPESFHGELRPYQLQGVSWLAFLRRFGLGGCLADDMGLGKTIQFTAYLQHIIEQGNGQGPSLLICPTSVIGNWEKELERFAPTLRVLVHYGPRRDRGEAFAAAAAEADLVITSYALTPIDEEELCGMQWDVVCLDEAQNIKNYYTKQSGVIRKLPSNHRVALTGTPMENRLTELWSIYDFTNPGYLGSLNEFRKAVVVPIERERNAEIINELQRWVKPFMLRRVKKDPAIQLALPDKNETRTYLSLTVEQGTLYENIVSELLGKLESLGAMQRRGLILSTLTRLKQVCDHPNLLLKEEIKNAWDPERSNKVLRVLEMVEEIAAEGERCLIFTQYVEMGETLKRLLEERLNVAVPYLYGGVPKAARDAMIRKFQDEEQPGCAFVLSLKAGGTGLNLTAANHVIHFDRWWNPAVENQATDRAFRIGQTRNVQVHKYVTLGTLEERIDDMITRKQTLNDQVVGQSENWITELSTDELRELFSLRKQRLKG
ncbi:DEAD/DEAH box helicase [Paenibacillus oenotherae]|uniref:DEAD/DEAH box helicase n=2 Tax=Paenibacillus oenotherae TaxID=1435645 RepID=A0ABS7D4Q8_9BACL|nr:DEAD/DEAH box helicase [Paenibacillus oenotherae]